MVNTVKSNCPVLAGMAKQTRKKTGFDTRKNTRYFISNTKTETNSLDV